MVFLIFYASRDSCLLEMGDIFLSCGYLARIDDCLELFQMWIFIFFSDRSCLLPISHLLSRHLKNVNNIRSNLRPNFIRNLEYYSEV